MKAIVASKDELIALAAAVDLALGMPLAGVDVGVGSHAPPEECITLRYAELREHPTTKGTWAYPLDATCRPIVADKQVEDGKLADPNAVKLAGEVELGTDWVAKDPVEAAPKEPAPVVTK